MSILRRKAKKSKKGIVVTVARTGSPLIKVALNGDRTIDAALKAAGLSQKESEEAMVNGESVDNDYELRDGDRVILVKNVSGGR